jgi:hypothetical protein
VDSLKLTPLEDGCRARRNAKVDAQGWLLLSALCSWLGSDAKAVEKGLFLACEREHLDLPRLSHAAALPHQPGHLVHRVV